MRQWIALLLVLLLAGGLGLKWWKSDERQIQRALDFVTERVEKSPGENKLLGHLAATEIGSSFAESFRFRARQFDYETRNREDLVRTIGRYRARSERIVAQVLDQSLEIAPSGEAALMVVAIRFQGALGPRLGDSRNDAYRFRIDWTKGEEGWKIENVDLDEILQPSDQ